MIHVVLISTLFLFFQSSFGADWEFSSADQAVQITDQVADSFLLTDISYSSDAYLSKEEFQYLTELRAGMQVDAPMLRRAVAYLFQKNISDSITLSLIDDGDGKKAQFNLKGFWRFEKIKVGGIWVGKEWYKQFYLMEPGDRFDADKHAHSIQKMKDACRKDGFFNVSTTSNFVHNEKSKSVTVQTNITRGGRFAIRAIAVDIKADREVDAKEVQKLHKKIQRKLSHGLLNAKYSKKLIEEQAKELKHFLAHKGYLHVSMNLNENLFKARHAVELQWTVHIRKKRDFVFFGNRFFSSSYLLEQVLQFGRSAFIVPASILAHEIKQAYQDKGFWNLEIDTKDEGDRSFFIIKEGARAGIDSVQLVGAKYFSEKYLLKRCFAKLKRHAVFEQELLNHAFDVLTDTYLKKGFLDFSIVHHEFVPENDKKRYRLVITVKEGIQSVIDLVKIPGYELYEAQGPFAVINRAQVPVPYDAALIQEQKRFLSLQLQKQGYLFPAIKHEIQECDGAYCLIWQINPGKQILFGKTIVQSDSELPLDVIVRDLFYEGGEKWDSEKIKQSFTRLKERHLFDSISFTPLAVKEEGVSRDILLKLHKDDPFELRVRAGLEFQYVRQYQTFAGVAYKVGSTFMVKNVSNHGDFFRFDADVARSHREVHMKYQYPWIFRTPFDGVLRAYGNKYDQPGFIGSKKNLYTLYQNGLLAGLRHKNQYIDAGLNVGFEVGRTAFSDDDLKTRAAAIRLAQSINFDVKLLDQKIPYIFVEPTIMVDLLDNNLYPTKGMFTLLSCKGMFPTNSRFSQAYFLKFLIEHSWFVPLKQVVAAFRFRFGHIFHKQFSDIMPNERFYLGGSHSVRSYETDLAPPTNEFVDDDGKMHAVPRGGKTMLNVNAELRIPVAKKAGLVLFQDLGLLCGDSFADFHANNLVAGTGFGLRFNTPIGPLRFDIGWKWRRDRPDERSFNWVLTFGQAF